MQCAVCTSRDTQRIGVQRGWILFGCPDCGFHFARPGDNPDLPAYDERYFESFIRRDERAEWRTFYEGCLDHLQRHAPGRRLLDAGSGASLFAPTAKRNGWKVTVIDGSPQAINVQSLHYGIKAAIADLNRRDAIPSSLGPQSRFDAVNSWHVIEHLSNPDAYLEGIHDVLEPGGCLLLGLPIYPWGRVRFHEALHWLGLAKHPTNLGLPDHIAFFDRRTILLLLNRIGFRLQTVERTAFTSLCDAVNGWSPGGLIRTAVKACVCILSPMTRRLGFYNHLMIIAVKR